MDHANEHRSSELQPQDISLLELPVEIQLMILEHLLVTPEPIACQPQDRIDNAVLLENWISEVEPHAVYQDREEGEHFCHPNILATCRNLYNTGQHLLYRNTIAVTYFVDDFVSGDRRAYAPGGHRSIQAMLSQYPLCKQIKRWRFNIWCETRSGLLEEVYFEDWTAMVSHDAMALRLIGRLDHVWLNVLLLKPFDSADFPEQEPEDNSHVLYNPLRSIRSDRCVASLEWSGLRCGVSYAMEEYYIEADITSDNEPIYPIDMYHKLVKILNKLLTESDGKVWVDRALGNPGSYHLNDQHASLKLPTFGNLENLEISLKELAYSINIVQYAYSYSIADYVLQLILKYIEEAQKHLDRKTGETQTGTWITQEAKWIRRQKLFLENVQDETNSLKQAYRLGHLPP